MTLFTKKPQYGVILLTFFASCFILTRAVRSDFFRYECSAQDLSWNSAADYCKSGGGQLLSLLDETATRAVDQCEHQWQSQPGYAAYFLGLKWTRANGWQWFRGNTSLDYWETPGRQPYDCARCTKCVIAVKADSWHRHNCSHAAKMKFICEYQIPAPTTVPILSPSTTESQEDCDGKYCKNGGRCRRHSGSGKASCRCANGFKGDECERITCNNDCSSHGTCLIDVFGNYKCRCGPKFTGESCQIYRNCSKETCIGGRCVGDVCSCYPGFSGVWCDIRSEGMHDASDQDSDGTNYHHGSWRFLGACLVVVAMVVLAISAATILQKCRRRNKQYQSMASVSMTDQPQPYAALPSQGTRVSGHYDYETVNDADVHTYANCDANLFPATQERINVEGRFYETPLFTEPERNGSPSLPSMQESPYLLPETNRQPCSDPSEIPDLYLTTDRPVDIFRDRSLDRTAIV